MSYLTTLQNYFQRTKRLFTFVKIYIKALWLDWSQYLIQFIRPWLITYPNIGRLYYGYNNLIQNNENEFEIIEALNCPENLFADYTADTMPGRYQNVTSKVLTYMLSHSVHLAAELQQYMKYPYLIIRFRNVETNDVKYMEFKLDAELDVTEKHNIKRLNFGEIVLSDE